MSFIRQYNIADKLRIRCANRFFQMHLYQIKKQNNT